MELVALVFLGNSIIITFFYITDRELKFLSRQGIKQYEQIQLNKGKYLFIYYERKKGMITKCIYKRMIVYYIVYGAGFVVLFFLYIAKNDSLITLCCAILVFANIGLLPLAFPEPRLTPAQEKMRSDYMQKQREEYLRKRRERKQNKLKLKGK